ncbi:MAG: hypothetical protein K0S32_3132 [Bacteroidetes bacterium]|nr:hypothetical protein [Bacteroidota bacterium]
MTTDNTNDIDILLTLNPHGWSTCYIVKDGKCFELTISHVFGDPYSDLINALTALINNGNEVSFFWYGEPGGEKIEIKRVKDNNHMVNVLVNGFYESYGDLIKDFELTVEFQIKLRQLITLFYLQLRKTFLLLKDKEYSKNRQEDFPFDVYLKFEALVTIYLQSKERL